MRIPKLKKFTAVEVIWEDSNIPTEPGWMSEDEHTDWIGSAGSVVRTVGVYISHNKSFINLVGDCDYEDVPSPTYLRPINIGLGFIKEIHVLERKQPIDGRSKK